MLLTVNVIAKQRQSLSVPELAVVGDGEDRFVFVVEDGKAKRTKVDTGIRQNGLVEILGGVKAGQTVVTDGVVKLTDGVPVRRSEEHTSELQSLMRSSYAVFCLKKKTITTAT